MTIRVDLLLGVLPIMGNGILGIFLVTVAIIVVVTILSRWNGKEL